MTLSVETMEAKKTQSDLLVINLCSSQHLSAHFPLFLKQVFALCFFPSSFLFLQGTELPLVILTTLYLVEVESMEAQRTRSNLLAINLLFFLASLSLLSLLIFPSIETRSFSDGPVVYDHVTLRASTGF